MKKTVLFVVLAFLTFGCLNSETGDTGGADPNELVGLWDIWEIREDGFVQLFINGRLNFSSGVIAGFIYDYKAVEDCEFEGMYFANGHDINVDISSTTNPGIIPTGSDSYYYEIDGNQLYVSFTSPGGHQIEIRAVRI